jgi:cobyrinic acid a,c-diamide synthase
MISATASGSGKTLITCGILQALVNRGYQVASFKCGPDYIDPMFHSQIIGAKSRNLDTFFSEAETIKYLFEKTARTADVSIMEGVMGYYDGLGGTSTRASSYELACITNTPVILVVNCKGMSLSLLAVIKGFLEYCPNSQIEGVILNQISKNLYLEMKSLIEEKLSIKVFGYVPFIKNLVLESRHLGLVTPEKVVDLHAKLQDLAVILEETLELDQILESARNTEELCCQKPVIPQIEGNPVIAVARDEAFCFYYEDNLELLKEMGATLVEFSPINDKHLPAGVSGLLLGGGYPELAAECLSQNTSMLKSVKSGLEKGLPCLAECGGFMYLHEMMEDMHGKSYKMVGAIQGNVYKTNQLNRFGYINLISNDNQMIANQGESIAAHEFHYYESSNCGDSFTAKKPTKNVQWNCIHGNDQLAVGFPHLYYYSNLKVPYRFLIKCNEFTKNNV